MKQVFFNKIKMETSIGEFRDVDLRKELGNLVFSNALTIEEDSFARRIHDAPDEGTECSGAELERLMEILKSAGVKYAVIKAIEKTIDKAK